jgi:hypothetical protein
MQSLPRHSCGPQLMQWPRQQGLIYPNGLIVARIIAMKWGFLRDFFILVAENGNNAAPHPSFVSCLSPLAERLWWPQRKLYI